MDYLSLAVGFLVGTLTGASGTYFGNKYTDIRHRQEQKKAEREMWLTLERKYPNLISEMKEDFSNPQNLSIRKFAIKSSKMTLNVGERCFEYHTDKHIDIFSSVDHLKDLGLVEELYVPGCPMYRFKERFAEYLIGKNA
ncbi:MULTISPECIES: hypothetical protein [Vibrio]|uniref:hypothetical protein n=1 Tax=Vibrio TaxID=662 RepID=UPI0005F08BC2|nr:MULTISPECIES: hypothetical protein [Vibrio]EKF9492418.1 hypothetical protein [Vibrio cholerae]KJR27761.1 hypothetical protein UF06_15755 [Vibrio sp. S234-5]MBE4606026.1 hypothetical protein [Vibrio navarrensis]